MSKRAVLLKALAATPNDLARLLRSSAATADPPPGHWTAAQVAAHLADVETHYRRRLQRVVAEDRPQLPYIHPDESAYDPALSAAAWLGRFRTERAATLAFLEGLSPGAWQRPAVHQTWGPTTLRFLVQSLVEHDTNHLNQIARLADGRTAQETTS
ncbi:MAG: DinB family protein [Candidatus Promineifilaceae bacterium]|nr:DinB family protein [Candidatus Promineifilaceae bacterium]